MYLSKRGLTSMVAVPLVALILSSVLVSQPALARRHAVPTATDYTQFVNPMIGTANDGETFPGADVPFGMVQFSPDTNNAVPGGYDYGNNVIRGFSLTHLSGAGCNGYGDLPFMPYVGTVTTSPASNPDTYTATYSHTNESASAGYYKVGLDSGATTELTTTQRSGAARFTYPAGQTASLLANVAGSVNGDANAQVTIGSDNTLSGFATSSGFCGATAQYTVYFWAKFSQPFATSGTWNNSTLAQSVKSVKGSSKASPAVQAANAAQVKVMHGNHQKSVKTTATGPADATVAGSGVGAYVTFASTSVEMQVGLSFVSIANAQANVTQENPTSSFDDVRTHAVQAWNNRLGEIAVTGGTSDQQTTFYTALYHALLQPNIFSDANGQYIGFDGKTYTASSGHAQYANFSGWDIYRSEAQLLGLLAPSEASDIAQSMVNDDAQGGLLPKWSFANTETYVMVGDPADPIIADLYAFGGTNFDTQGALTAMVKEATQTTNNRPGLNYLQSLGYLPTDGNYGCCNYYGAASTTLEYNTADFAIGAFAQALGDTTNYQTFTNRAQDWHNLLNTNDAALEPRAQNGSFDPNNSNAWVEGTGAQYNWMVPFNLAGLFAGEGGNSAITPRLDTFFTQLLGGYSQYAYLGNEPSLESPWEYDYAGAPYRTQSVVRQAVNTLYGTTAAGLDGNDDLGEMASWYVWSALGMYPEVPGKAELALGSPLFPSITVSRPGGQTIQINAPNASANTYYVQSLNVNGSASTKPWLPASFIANGGTLDYTLGTTANTSWGADPADAPPSFGTVGTPPPPTTTFSTGFESGDPLPTWTNTVDDAGFPAGGIANIGGYCCGLSGPETGTRTEVAHVGSTALMYSGLAQGQAHDYAYLKVFDFSGSPVPVGANTTLSYWIYPQSHTSQSGVAGTNSTCVAIDLIFSDATNLRDSGATDQSGNKAHPAYQCNQLTLDTWNHVTVALGGVRNGKSIVRLDLAYDQPNSSGGYRGYVDDIAIS